MKDHYNDDEMGIIIVKHYPFKNYKIKRYKPRRKPKLTMQQMLSIINVEVKRNSRMEQAKELFMLSFYLCGMNAVDMCQLKKTDTVPKRIDYNRSKTKGRRTDEAFISIKLVKDAQDIYMKYAGVLSRRYCDHLNLDRALATGMRQIGKKLNIPDLEFYDARHAFADWARNKCRYSKDDIGLALNHIDDETNVTDLYISRDWFIIDEMQASVIKLLKKSNKKINRQMKPP